MLSLTYVDGSDPSSRLVYEALAQYIQSIWTRSRKQIPERRLGEVANGDVVGQLGVSLSIREY